LKLTKLTTIPISNNGNTLGFVTKILDVKFEVPEISGSQKFLRGVD